MSDQSQPDWLAGLDFDRWSSFGGQALNPFGGFSQGCFKALAEMNAENFRFITKRLGEDVRLATSYAQCKGPSDVFDLQAAYVDCMIDDYAEHGGKLFALAASSVGAQAPASEPAPVPEKVETKTPVAKAA